eukprot:gene1870-2207_t
MNGYWLSSPLVSGGTIASCCCGRFRGSNIVDAVLQHQDLQLLAVTPDGKLLKLFTQPFLSDARQMRLLPTRQGVDLLAVLLRSGTLALLSYDSDLVRFVVVKELTLAYGEPTFWGHADQGAVTGDVSCAVTDLHFFHHGVVVIEGRALLIWKERAAPAGERVGKWAKEARESNTE